MSNIDVNTLEKGDTVSVQGILTAIGGVWSFVKFADQPHSLSVRNDAIVSVEPRPLAVGDKVKDRGAGSWVGDLVSVDGMSGWVRISKNNLKTVWLDDIQRA